MYVRLSPGTVYRLNSGQMFMADLDPTPEARLTTLVLPGNLLQSLVSIFD